MAPQRRHKHTCKLHLADIIEDHDTKQLGIDTLPQVVTRGPADRRGGILRRQRLQPGDVITAADAENASPVALLRTPDLCNARPAAPARPRPAGGDLV